MPERLEISAEFDKADAELKETADAANEAIGQLYNDARRELGLTVPPNAPPAQPEEGA